MNLMMMVSNCAAHSGRALYRNGFQINITVGVAFLYDFLPKVYLSVFNHVEVCNRLQTLKVRVRHFESHEMQKLPTQRECQHRAWGSVWTLNFWMEKKRKTKPSIFLEVMLPQHFLAALSFVQLSRPNADLCFHSENSAGLLDGSEKGCNVK